jgi:hypothetical protein
LLLPASLVISLGREGERRLADLGAARDCCRLHQPWATASPCVGFDPVDDRLLLWHHAAGGLLHRHGVEQLQPAVNAGACRSTVVHIFRALRPRPPVVAGLSPWGCSIVDWVKVRSCFTDGDFLPTSFFPIFFPLSFPVSRVTVSGSFWFFSVSSAVAGARVWLRPVRLLI